MENCSRFCSINLWLNKYIYIYIYIYYIYIKPYYKTKSVTDLRYEDEYVYGKHGILSCIQELSSSICYIHTHPALNQVYEILWRDHKHVLKSSRLHSVLPSPPIATFWDPRIILAPIFMVIDCDICKVLESEDQFESTITYKKSRFNFPYDCNSCCVVYLLACKVCLKQYVGSIIYY